MQNTYRIIREQLSSALDAHGQHLYDDREARTVTDLLFEEVCGITRVDRVMHPECQLDEAQHNKLFDCASRLCKGEPVQQVLGFAWFHGERFLVTPDVLIPRPETAELVDWIADFVQPFSQLSALSPSAEPKGNKAPIRILDIGTGSGCIAITLARVINISTVLGIDLSTAALEVACRNAFQQGVDNVQFAQYDILKCVDNLPQKMVSNAFIPSYQQGNEQSYQQQLSTGYQQFDVIVSNPPYICRKEAKEMSDIVLSHEPDLALFVPDEDPLIFYRAIAQFGRQYLSAEGQLFFEINAAYGRETCELLEQLSYQDIELRQDINGRDRMVRARR